MGLTINDFQAIWLTVFGESRGEPIEGQIGVANVINNRKMETGHQYNQIVLEPLQFSCWNPNDPNYNLLAGMALNNPSSPIINQIQYISQGIIDGKIQDNTKGANHYLEVSLYRGPSCPNWARTGEFKIQIGRHVFIWCK